MTMTDLAAWLSSSAGQLVLDRTELSGKWNVDLTWAQPSRGALDGVTSPSTTDPDRPSIFTAVQEQLGLKLEATRLLIEVLVIDRAERPLPD